MLRRTGGSTGRRPDPATTTEAALRATGRGRWIVGAVIRAVGAVADAPQPLAVLREAPRPPPPRRRVTLFPLPPAPRCPLGGGGGAETAG